MWSSTPNELGQSELSVSEMKFGYSDGIRTAPNLTVHPKMEIHLSFTIFSTVSKYHYAFVLEKSKKFLILKQKRLVRHILKLVRCLRHCSLSEHIFRHIRTSGRTLFLKSDFEKFSDMNRSSDRSTIMIQLPVWSISKYFAMTSQMVKLVFYSWKPKKQVSWKAEIVAKIF